MSRKVADKLPPMSEAEFQEQVEQYARLMGWRLYHTRYSFGSSKGFPDLAAVRREVLVFAELKRDGKGPTPEQAAWLRDLSAVEVVTTQLWTPATWEQVEEILRR
jgi:hypothetical protein